MKTFLSAEWRDLVNLTYEVPPELLTPYLPQGLELDLYDGKAHASLVAFDFLNTKVKGVKVPFHVNFPEVNLRFYAHYKGRRGVVFIKEYVPKHCIALIANRFYNEPYVSYPMESERTEEEQDLRVQHRIWKDKDKFNLIVRASGDFETPGPDTVEHFFKEHELGFGRDKKGETLYYFVEHPIWATRPLEIERLDFDFGKLYGPEWTFLNEQEPRYKLYCQGSAVKVYSSVRLKELDNIPLSDFKKG